MGISVVALPISYHKKPMCGSRGRVGEWAHPLENYKLLYVSLEILVGTPLEKQLDALGPIASLGGSYGTV